MEEGSVNIYVPTTKYFRVNRINFKGSKYTGDCSGLAYWYYMVTSTQRKRKGKLEKGKKRKKSK